MVFFIKTFGIFKKKSYLCGLKYAVNFTIMKTNWKKSIVLTILLSFVLMPNAWAFQYLHEGNTLEYTTIDNDHVSVSNAGNQLTNNLVIPSQVKYDGKTYTVTHVGSSGFYEEPIVSLTLPNTIKEIGYKAFAHCTNLSDLTISSDIIIINNQAFYGCTNLKNITFNGDIEILGDQTFFGCSSLTSVNFIGTVNTIGNQTFYECYNLTSINFYQTTPPSLNLRKITDEANFSKIIFTIPDNTINAYVQTWSSLLPHIYERSNNVFFIGGLIYTKNNNEVSVRNGCASGTLIIGNSIKHRDGNSYNITSIESKAFYKTSFTSIQLGNNIKRIEQQAFARINGMIGKTIIFPSSLEYIGNDAFITCASTYKFTSNTLPTLGEEVYDIFPLVDDDENMNYGINFVVPSCKAFQSIPTNWNYPFFTDFASLENTDKCSYNINKDQNGDITDIPTNKSQEEFGKITYTRFFKPGVWETLYLPFEIESMLIDEENYKDGAWVNETKPCYFYLAKKLDNGTTEFEMVSTINKNTAYIIQFPDYSYYETHPVTFVSKENYNYIPNDWNQQKNSLTMYGNTTLQKQTITNAYYLGNDNNFKLASSHTLNPFECYIAPGNIQTPRFAVQIRQQNGTTTDIPTIDTNQLLWYRNGNTLIIHTGGKPVSIYNINGALIQSFEEGQEQIRVELTSGYYIINSAGTAQKIIF